MKLLLCVGVPGRSEVADLGSLEPWPGNILEMKLAMAINQRQRQAGMVGKADSRVGSAGYQLCFL